MVVENEHWRQTWRVVSYNVFMRPPGISSDKHGDLKNERLQTMIVDLLPAYDIVCLQEMFNLCNCRRQKLIDAAVKRGFKYYSVPPDAPLFSSYWVNSGLLTLSKVPIVLTKFMPFKAGSGVDKYAYKGLLYSRLSVGKNRFVNLFNVHLQAHYNSDDRDNIQARLDQIVEIRSFVVELLANYAGLEDGRPFQEAVYLLGDFNVCPYKNIFPKDGYLK